MFPQIKECKFLLNSKCNERKAVLINEKIKVTSEILS